MPRALHVCLAGLAAVLVAGCGHLSRPVINAPKYSGLANPSLRSASRQPGGHGKSAETEDTALRSVAHAHYATGVIHELNGETAPALEEFIKAAAADPGNESLMLEVTQRLIQQRKLEEAAALLTLAVERPGVSGAVLARMGVVYYQLGRIPEFLEASRAAIRKDPATLPAYQTLFVHYMESRQTGQAFETLEQAAAVAKPSTDFLVGLADLYRTYAIQVPEQKKVAGDKALALLSKAKDKKPSDPLLQLKIADGFSQLGETATAREIYDRLLSLEDQNPVLVDNVRAKLANIYLRAEDRTNAVAQLKALTLSDPTNPQPYYLLGSIALENNNAEEAADYFSKVVVLNPGFADAYYQLANAQVFLDRPQEALATLESARQKFKPNYALEFLSGVAASRLKDYDRALGYFTSAEVTAKASGTKELTHFFYFQLGVTYEQKKDFAQAAKAFQKCLELSPGFTEAMNYLGYMWADQGVELDRALELLKKAVAAEPKNAAYLDSLGWAYFKRKQLPEALENVSKAVDLSEEPDATLLEHLGDIFAAMGQNAKAVEAYEKSWKLAPSEGVRSKIEAAKQSK